MSGDSTVRYLGAWLDSFWGKKTRSDQVNRSSSSSSRIRKVSKATIGVLDVRGEMGPVSYKASRSNRASCYGNDFSGCHRWMWEICKKPKAFMALLVV